METVHQFLFCQRVRRQPHFVVIWFKNDRHPVMDFTYKRIGIGSDDGTGNQDITKVKNLSTFAVGDKIKARYYMSLASEIGTATPEEKKTPSEKLDETCPLPPRATPGSEVKMFRDVGKVEMFDNLAGFLVVKDSTGHDIWINIDNQSLKSNIKLGNLIVVKHTQPYIIALKKL